MNELQIVKCDFCDCFYHTTTVSASFKTCSLCEEYPSAEDRFAPIVLLDKVLSSGFINTLSRFELYELHISRVFQTNPALREIEIFDTLAYFLSILFEDENTSG